MKIYRIKILIYDGKNRKQVNISRLYPSIKAAKANVEWEHRFLADQQSRGEVTKSVIEFSWVETLSVRNKDKTPFAPFVKERLMHVYERGVWTLR